NPGEIPNNSIDDDSNGFIDDVNGWDFFHNDKTVFDGSGAYPSDDTDAHGTHVAGTIGAVGNNSIGVVGVNWQSSLMSLKVLGRDGESGAPSSVMVTVRAYNYAKMMRDRWVSTGGTKGANIRVLNNSYGGGGRSQAELDAIRALNTSGILFVAAAGNDSRNDDWNPVYPASYDAPNVISVAATNPDDSVSYFSNYGKQTVDLGAPGDDILSTTPNGTYDRYSGTSMASPHVAGAAALVCAANPDISVQRLRAALIYGSEVVTYTDLRIKVYSLRRLSALKALKTAAENDTTPPAAVSNLKLKSQTQRYVNVEWLAPGDNNKTGTAALYETRFTDTQPTTAAQFEQGQPLDAPYASPAGYPQTFSDSTPFRHTSGFISVRAIDNAGNAGPISSIPVSIPVEAGDPYVVTTAAAKPLSTGGTPLNVKGDDIHGGSYSLPFYFPFMGTTYTSVTVSTNGALYINYPDAWTSGLPIDDAQSSVRGLVSYRRIAGIWDDLRTDRRASDDIYVVKPDADRIIFRWQAVTYDTPISPTAKRGENPVSFEIELQRNGTILLRYGAGNQKLWPVVGIAADEPDAYPVASHTSEAALKNLTNAQTVIFTPYNVAFPPPVVVKSLTVAPASVVEGKTATGKVTIGKPAPVGGSVVKLSDDLAATTLPTSVTVTEGMSEASFVINTTHPGSAPQVGTVTASADGSSATAPFTVKPISPIALAFGPNPVLGGGNASGAVTLNGPAPAGGAVVALSDNLAATTLPASVTVPAGKISATFNVTTAVVAAKQTGAVTASYNGTKSSTLTVRPVGLLSLAVSPNRVVGGGSLTGTVTLERASIADIAVTLTDTLASTTVPTSVVVPKGQTTKSFIITTAAVNKFESGALTAAANATTKSATFMVNPASAAVCNEPSFKLFSRVQVNRSFSAVAVLDFNLDGRADLVTASSIPSVLSTYAGDGIGGLGVPVDYSVAANPADGWAYSRGLAYGDFNRDGKPDLVVTSTANKTVAVLLGNGAGGFTAPSHFSTAYTPHSIVVGDFNKDLKPDVAVTSTDAIYPAVNGYVELLLGDGAGRLGAPKTFRAGETTQGLVKGDFNRDGKLDLAAANQVGGVSVLLGNGAGSFGTVTYNLFSGYATDYLDVGDFNKDGKQDLAVVVSNARSVAILLGNGSGAFSLGQTIVVSSQPTRRISVADMNGDGKDDLFVTDATTQLWGLLGNGQGGFSAPKTYPAEGTTNFNLIGPGDFNGDGRLDLAAPAITLNTCG
ncbi:MAG TPA: FG-GAP-like repeat-containing protein, partial [Pyrinomonadaceae bacterium]|nr:FG-GAP-like repeat-containing protein [Pyrinomonadaceae bacterium]